MDWVHTTAVAVGGLIGLIINYGLPPQIRVRGIELMIGGCEVYLGIILMLIGGLVCHAIYVWAT